MNSEPQLPQRASAAPAGMGVRERRRIAGRYQLLEEIAEGGMGKVFLAEHVLSHKKLAIKVVFPHLCRGRQGVERFKREVSAAATIDHPGIVQVYDAGVDDDGAFFMAMELLHGESLGDLMRRHWPGMATSIAFVEEVLEPLAKAHAKGFVHRDLKPDNIFLARNDEGRIRVKLLDFGLAREVDKSGPTQTGTTFGTPEYMSPEQAISARKVRSPGDIWSMGVILYELLSGCHPFSGETPNAIMANAIKEKLPPLTKRAPHVPKKLARFVERCLTKDPTKRPQNAGQMLYEFRNVLEKIELNDIAPVDPVAPMNGRSQRGSHPISCELPVSVASAPTIGTIPSIERAGRPRVPQQHEPSPKSEEVETPKRKRGLVRGIILGVSVMSLLFLGGFVLMLNSERNVDEAGFDASSMRDAVTSAVPESFDTEVTDRMDTTAAMAANDQTTPLNLREDGIRNTTSETDEASDRESSVEAAIERENTSSVTTRRVRRARSQRADEIARTQSNRAPAREVRGSATASENDTSESQRQSESASGNQMAVLQRPRLSIAESAEVRACASRGDHGCMIRLLNGRARSSSEYVMLIDALRASRGTPAALQTIRTYVRRWPRSERATTYRTILDQYGAAN